MQDFTRKVAQLGIGLVVQPLKPSVAQSRDLSDSR